MRIDAHQHFWLYDPIKDGWINDDMQALRRNFLPNDIAQTLKDNKIDGIVAVQADQSHRETAFLVELAGVYKVIKAVVGWVDLVSPEIEAQLEQFKQHSIIKGFRHIVEAEAAPDFMLRDDFQRGIAALTKLGYTYDLLLRPRHYAAAFACVKAHPGQAFMLDHIAKPPIKSQEFDEWAQFIADLAQCPNVYCKVSGLATEADWKHWKLDHFTQYIDHIVSCFGIGRLCYGSDWPVCLLAASYEEVMEIVERKLSQFSAAELAGFWGDNAVRFYGIK